MTRKARIRGLGGEIDFRALHKQIESGNSDAELAYDVYIHRLRKYIGAYLAVRRDALTGLAPLGIELDEHLNDSPARGARLISADRSPITVLVIPTNEELAIARDCLTVR